uniref:Uncharacterized protein n=1 Tax=Arundo donax TaxID=35708 RepID=A0A0A8ZZ55_ARUDO
MQANSMIHSRLTAE